MNSIRDKPELSAAQPVPLNNTVVHQRPGPANQPDRVSEDIEEGKSAYQSGGFHPVYIGDIFDERFKVLNKIGYGRYSTVWLVKDLQAR